MNKPLRLIVLAVVVLAGVFSYSYFQKDSRQDQLVLYGNVDIRQVDLGFLVQGRLDTMLFEEGDSVNKGDILAKLEQSPFLHEREAAEARVARSEAFLLKLQNGSRPQEIKTAKAQVQETEAIYSNALRNLNRQKELYVDQATSRIALDQAKALHDEVAARLAAAREKLTLVQEGPRLEDIKAAHAQLQEATAQRELAATRLQDCSLKAPGNGTILTRIREPGAIVGIGMAVYTLSIDAPVYVRAYVNESNLGRIHPGQIVEITTDSQEQIYTGKIGFIAPRAEFTPKNVETPELRTALVYRLRIIVQDRVDGLRQGMPVTINIPQ